MRIVLFTTLLCIAGCSSSNFGGGSSSAAGEKKKDVSEKNGNEDGEDTPADDPVEIAGAYNKPDLLRIDPETLTLFKGETATLKALMVQGGDEAEADVTEDVTWSSGDDGIAKIAPGGKLTAVGPGGVDIEAATESGQSAQMKLQVVKCKNTTTGTKASSVKIDGENWPNNTVDPGGGDKDDYHVTITGDLLADGFQLYAAKEQSLSVSYALGSPGSTTQTVSLAIIDCDGQVVSSNDVSTGSGTHEFQVKKGQRFTLITTAHTGAVTRNFRLDQDTADATAQDSFRVTAQ